MRITIEILIFKMRHLILDTRYKTIYTRRVDHSLGRMYLHAVFTRMSLLKKNA